MAARRLVDNARAIGISVDLSGASIAIDDCYELWDSGFISIPYDFQARWRSSGFIFIFFNFPSNFRLFPLEYLFRT